MNKLVKAGIIAVAMSGNVISPISVSNVRLASALTGAGTFAAGCALSRRVDYVWLLAAPASLLVGWIVHEILYEYTPEGRFERAQEFVQKMSRNPITVQEFATQSDLTNVLQEVYVMSDLWLISAYQDLASVLNRAQKELYSLENAREEKYGDRLFMRACDALITRLTRATDYLTKAIKLIRLNPEYIQQVKIHKEMLARERELAVQQMMAHAQMQSAMAQTQIANAQRDIADIKGVKAAYDIARS